MKFNVKILLIFNFAFAGAKAMDYRNFETVKVFLEHYQKDKNTSCIIHFLDTFVNFDFVKNYKFQFTNGLLFNTFDSKLLIGDFFHPKITTS